MKNILQIQSMILDNVEEQKEKIKDKLNTDQEIVLDFSNLTKIDLAGWNGIVHLFAWSKENKKRLKLVGKTNPELSLFIHLAKMDFIF